MPNNSLRLQTNTFYQLFDISKFLPVISSLKVLLKILLEIQNAIHLLFLQTFVRILENSQC